MRKENTLTKQDSSLLIVTVYFPVVENPSRIVSTIQSGKKIKYWRLGLVEIVFFFVLNTFDNASISLACKGNVIACAQLYKYFRQSIDL